MLQSSACLPVLHYGQADHQDVKDGLEAVGHEQADQVVQPHQDVMLPAPGAQPASAQPASAAAGTGKPPAKKARASGQRRPPPAAPSAVHARQKAVTERMWQLLESTVSEQDLFQAVRMMTGQQYLEVAEERAVNSLCGSACCSRGLCTGLRERFLVDDQDQVSRQFCSRACEERTALVADHLGEENAAMSRFLHVPGRTAPAAAQPQAASHPPRGKKYAAGTSKNPVMLATVQERDPAEVAQASADRGSAAAAGGAVEAARGLVTSGAVEGYTPKQRVTRAAQATTSAVLPSVPEVPTSADMGPNLAEPAVSHVARGPAGTSTVPSQRQQPVGSSPIPNREAAAATSTEIAAAAVPFPHQQGVVAGSEEPQQPSRGALQDTVLERQPVSAMNAPAEPKAPRNSRFSSRQQRRNADEDEAADVLASTGALESPNLEATPGGASTQVKAAGQDPSAARPAARALTDGEPASSQALQAPPVLCFDISDADDPLEAGQHSMAARFGQLKVYDPEETDPGAALAQTAQGHIYPHHPHAPAVHTIADEERPGQSRKRVTFDEAQVPAASDSDSEGDALVERYLAESGDSDEDALQGLPQWEQPEGDFRAELTYFGSMYLSLDTWTSLHTFSYLHVPQPGSETAGPSADPGTTHAAEQPAHPAQAQDARRTLHRIMARTVPTVIKDLQITVDHSTVEREVHGLISTFSMGAEPIPAFKDAQWQLIVMAFLTGLAAFRLPWLGEALHGRIGLERQLQMLQARALTIEEFNALCSILLEPGAD